MKFWLTSFMQMILKIECNNEKLQFPVLPLFAFERTAYLTVFSNRYLYITKLIKFRYYLLISCFMVIGTDSLGNGCGEDLI